jgi:hypothetical protein
MIAVANIESPIGSSIADSGGEGVVGSVVVGDDSVVVGVVAGMEVVFGVVGGIVVVVVGVGSGMTYSGWRMRMHSKKASHATLSFTLIGVQ